MNRRQFIQLTGLSGLSLVVSVDLSGKILSLVKSVKKGRPGVALEKLISTKMVFPERGALSSAPKDSHFQRAEAFNTLWTNDVSFSPPMGPEYTVRTNMTGDNNQTDSGLFHEYTVRCDEGQKPELTFERSDGQPAPAYSVHETETANEYLVRLIIPVNEQTDDEPLTIYFGQAPTAIDNRIAPESLPRAFELQPNYPDPFNGSTRIPYRVTRAVYLRIEVYDMLGRKIRTLFKGRRKAGTYRVQWDGSDASGKAVGSGVYILKISSPDYSVSRPLQTERMLYIK